MTEHVSRHLLPLVLLLSLFEPVCFLQLCPIPIISQCVLYLLYLLPSQFFAPCHFVVIPSCFLVSLVFHGLLDLVTVLDFSMDCSVYLCQLKAHCKF